MGSSPDQAPTAYMPRTRDARHVRVIASIGLEVHYWTTMVGYVSGSVSLHQHRRGEVAKLPDVRSRKAAQRKRRLPGSDAAGTLVRSQSWAPARARSTARVRLGSSSAASSGPMMTD